MLASLAALVRPQATCKNPIAKKTIECDDWFSISFGCIGSGVVVGKGKKIKLTNGRRIVADIIRLANNMPLAAMRREFDLSDLAKLRRLTRPKISWNVIMMKAYAIVGAKMPIVRQSYASFPWPYLYEHEHNVCIMTMAREYEGEERLFFARFNRPEDHTLSELQQIYDGYRRDPIEDNRQFRSQINFSKAPHLFRRLAWYVMTYCWPRKRASHMGTFGMSLSGYKSGKFAQLLSPNTTAIGVDPQPRNGKSSVLLTFDHNVVDGKPCADIMEAFNHALHNQVMDELKSLVRVRGINPDTVLAENSKPALKRAA